MCKCVRLYLLFIDSIFSYYGCYVEWMHLSVFVAVVFFFNFYFFRDEYSLLELLTNIN